MLRRTVGVLIPRTQKNFPKEVFFLYVPGGILSLQSRLRSGANEANAPTNHWGSHPQNAKKTSQRKFSFYTSQEGYSLQSRLRSGANEANAPTNHWGSHPQNAKKTSQRKFSFYTSQEGFEPPTDALEGRCSIQLSY